MPCPPRTGLPQLACPSWPSRGTTAPGIGILVPSKQPPGCQEVDLNARTRNALRRSVLFQGERGFALLTACWRILQHITASPSKIWAPRYVGLILWSRAVADPHLTKRTRTRLIAR